MSGAGSLNQRVTFLRPVEAARTLTGGSKSGHVPAFTAWANIKYLRGGEGVLASRMEGRRPAILTLRNNTTARGVRLDWRVSIGATDYEVRELPRPIGTGGFCEVLVEAML